MSRSATYLVPSLGKGVEMSLSATFPAVRCAGERRWGRSVQSLQYRRLESTGTLDRHFLRCAVRGRSAGGGTFSLCSTDDWSRPGPSTAPAGSRAPIASRARHLALLRALFFQGFLNWPTLMAERAPLRATPLRARTDRFQADTNSARGAAGPPLAHGTDRSPRLVWR
jgi:hypothetical protein